MRREMIGRRNSLAMRDPLSYRPMDFFQISRLTLDSTIRPYCAAWISDLSCSRYRMPTSQILLLIILILAGSVGRRFPLSRYDLDTDLYVGS
jgi:hypothetical protein